MNTLAAFENLPDIAVVRVPVVCLVLGCSRATVWRMAKANQLATRKIGPHMTGFVVGSIRALLTGQQSAQ